MKKTVSIFKEKDEIFENESAMNESRFKNLTIFIVATTTLTAILIPNSK